MKESNAIRRIEKEIELLSSEDLLSLLDGIVHGLKKSLSPPPSYNWEDLYGVGRSLWEDDAQKYVERLRDDR